jgi:Predicted Zn-dependent hydrolases of the beta-lactamase fold
MIITKYPQSCLMIETNDKKILIDPGTLKYKEEYLNEWKKVDIVLITHKHPDHANVEVLKEMGVAIYSTSEVSNSFPELNINIIKEGDLFNIASIKIEVVKAIHGYNPLLKGSKEIFENVGYIIDDGETRFYTTSDTICFANDYKADVVAIPVTAHGITMSSYEASLFVKELDASLVLPIHMDSEFYSTNFEYLRENFDKEELNYKILDIEESIEV